MGNKKDQHCWRITKFSYTIEVRFLFSSVYYVVVLTVELVERNLFIIIVYSPNIITFLSQSYLFINLFNFVNLRSHRKQIPKSLTSSSIGDDLTKISLPSVLLFPYSALELGCSKGLSHIYLLFKYRNKFKSFSNSERANQETDPVARLIGVIRWYLTYTQQEKVLNSTTPLLTLLAR